ncbi:hypothetical protein BASA60_011313 [Batrachochytrium salamandrivorans]|nr:hypothetical protein BASA60_011313 [Batrachochytrium salamandrivorans]
MKKPRLDEEARLEEEAKLEEARLKKVRLEAAKIEKAKIDEAKIEKAKEEVAKQRQSESKQKSAGTGDLHGDFEMSVETLQMAKIINDDLEWIAGNTILVQTAFSKHGDIGEYLRTLGIAAKVDDHCFFHAGANLQWSKMGIDVLHSCSSGAVDQDAKYISKVRSLVHMGPLWYRDLQKGKDNTFCDFV